MKKLIPFILLFSCIWIALTAIIFFAIWSEPNEKEPEEKLYHHTLRFTYIESEYDETTSYFMRKFTEHGAENITFSTEDRFLIVEFDMDAGSLNYRDELCTLDFKISRARPSTTDEPVISDLDVSDAYTEYNESDNTYSVFLVLNTEGQQKLAELTKKFEGSFLNVWIDYQEAYTMEDISPVTNGIFCIKGIETEQKAKDIVDIFKKPYFNLYASGRQRI